MEKSAKLMARVRPEEKRRVERAAERAGETVSEFIRRAIGLTAEADALERRTEEEVQQGVTGGP